MPYFILFHLLLIFEIYDYYYVFKNKGFLRFAYYFNCSCYFFYFQAAVFNIFYGCVVFMIRCQSWVLAFVSLLSFNSCFNLGVVIIPLFFRMIGVQIVGSVIDRALRQWIFNIIKNQDLWCFKSKNNVFYKIIYFLLFLLICWSSFPLSVELFFSWTTDFYVISMLPSEYL